MEEDNVNRNPAKLKKGKEGMMRDAKGRFCKASAKTTWGSEKNCCSKHKCAKAGKQFNEEDSVAKKIKIATLMDEVLELMEGIPNVISNPEEALAAIDNLIVAFANVREVCVQLIDLEKEKKKCTKKHTKRKEGSDVIPIEILNLAKEMGIPIENIISCGTVDLDTGEGSVYHRKR